MVLKHYSTIIFDCDGVILNSNHVKTEAFRLAALPWGEKAASELVNHHVANGGISRYQKFRHFLENIVPRGAADNGGPGLEEMLESYATAVRRGLTRCAVADNLPALRKATPKSRWMVVSGGAQEELREIFHTLGIADFFDSGIYGSPDSKDLILAREAEAGTIQFPGVFLGDSVYDYEASSRANLDFVFVSAWTELKDWRRFVARERLKHVATVAELS